MAIMRGLMDVIETRRLDLWTQHGPHVACSELPSTSPICLTFCHLEGDAGTIAAWNPCKRNGLLFPVRNVSGNKNAYTHYANQQRPWTQSRSSDYTLTIQPRHLRYI
ncbi:hypothetical protein JOB18_017360 [Solea senegalensis]|uniref:Uncharacterized protein n=1 Tax=Solea senegalensis TaxID=28829 RepID=A0AAV6QME1_SOLSE|nr:hypothetical protein JOB18_017360 [Solea senegalensis]